MDGLVKTVDNINDKSNLQFGNVKEFLGFIINSDGPDNSPWISVPKSKVVKLTRTLRRLLSKDIVQARTLARVTGICVAMTRAVLPGKLMLQSVYRLLASRTSWSDILYIDRFVKKDLKWWFDSLKELNGCPIQVKTMECQLIMDASGSGWGAVFEGQEANGLWTPELSHHQIIARC